MCHCGESVRTHDMGSGHSPVAEDCDCRCHDHKPYTVWTTRDGRHMRLTAMPQDHLENLFGYLEKRLLIEGRPKTTALRDARWSQAVSAELDRRRSVDADALAARSSAHDA
jgi:hypothetical protein